MKRILVLSTMLMMFVQVSAVWAQPTSIAIDGKYEGNNFLVANLTIAKNGQITGSGVFYGQNTVTNATYKYPFSISKGVTGQGELILTGKLAAGPDITIRATVPNGAQKFSYVINGKTYSYAGTGNVTVK